MAAEGNCRVYVGNLSWGTNNESLREHMTQAGDVKEARVMYGKDGRSRGCGIVEYATSDAADKAKQDLTDSELDGRKIFVREDREPRSEVVSSPSKVVYVGNLPFSLTNQQLEDHFSQAGEVEEATISVNPRNNRSKGWGVVKFTSLEAAEKAVDSLNSKELEGRKLIVRFDRNTPKEE